MVMSGYWWLRTAMSVYGWLQVFTSDYDVLTDGYRWLQVVTVVRNELLNISAIFIPG